MCKSTEMYWVLNWLILTKLRVLGNGTCVELRTDYYDFNIHFLYQILMLSPRVWTRSRSPDHRSVSSDPRWGSQRLSHSDPISGSLTQRQFKGPLRLRWPNFCCKTPGDWISYREGNKTSNYECVLSRKIFNIVGCTSVRLVHIYRYLFWSQFRNLCTKKLVQK